MLIIICFKNCSTKAKASVLYVFNVYTTPPFVFSLTDTNTF